MDGRTSPDTSRATGAALADEGAKGVMMVDSPPHQPQKQKYSKLLLKVAGTESMLILAVNGLVVNFWLFMSNLVVPVSSRVF